MAKKAVMLFQCVTEALVKQGLSEWAKAVPGGELLFNIAKDGYESYRQRLNVAEIKAEIAQLAQADQAEINGLAADAAAQAACNERERQQIAVYLAQIPGVIRQSQKRSEDPSGRTIAASFKMAEATDMAKLLPPSLPKFVVGAALPGADWTLKQLLGVGGFGEVWLAQNDHDENSRGAVKFCRSGRLSDHEVTLISRLMNAGHHPHIVKLLQARTKQTDEPWLMYQYIEGGDLGDLIHRWAGLSIAERQANTIATLTVLAGAIGYFHALNSPIVHRDLKPANILRDSKDQLYITDFGIGGVAAQRNLAVQGMTTTAGKLTSALYGSHTPLYASPQQQAGGEPDPQDDVHALGVIGYQMLTGQMMQGMGMGADRTLKKLGIAVDLIELLTDCTIQDAADRLPDAGAVLTALQGLNGRGAINRAVEESTAPPKQPPEPKPAPKQEQPPEPKPEPGPKAEEPKKTLWNLGGLLSGAKEEAKPQDRISGGQSKTYTEPKTGMEFIWVEGGRFQMGGKEYDDEKPVHWVKVAGFYMAKYPITQGQWKALMKDNPSNFKKGDDYPVENISWDDVTTIYLPKLNQLGHGTYCLPTEAEWEYAARSGGKAETYAGGENLDKVGWYSDNSGSSTHPVGKKQPNGLGLYDMSGNVWEWCADWYDSGYYGKSPEDNPRGPDSGSRRVSRGGSWSDSAEDCRTAYRNRFTLVFRFSILGARLVRRP